MKKSSVFGALAFVLASPLAHAADSDDATLCGAHEVVVFSCHVGKKIASLCHPDGAATSLSYRFGLPSRTELVYPDPLRHELARFSSSESVLYGGGAQTVTFRRGEYEYGVYSLLTREDDGQGNGAGGGDRTPVFEDGLVVSRGGKLVKKMVCDDGGLGFRDNIDWIKSK
jgi:hypothetical protein